MNTSRRKFVIGGAVATAGAATAAAQHQHGQQPTQDPDVRQGGSGADKKVERKRRQEKAPGRPPVLVEGPDLQKLEWTMENGVKVFHLRATVTQREFLPGKVVNVWGFNDQMPGPTIECFEGDRVRFVVHNELPEEFSVHWHGLEVPFEMDGVPGLEQDPIPPGGMFVYEFDLNQNGTFFYHSHMAMQEMMGMIGAFIIHPKVAHDPPVDRDFVFIWQEWAILPNNNTPNSLAMEFNWLTINGKAGPEATPALAKKGERIRLRNINLGMDHHPIHLHGNQFVVTGTEAGRKPQSTWFKENTVVLGVAQSRDFEFTADYYGDWMLHCHFPHHMMNAMASMVGPSMGIGKGSDLDKGMENGMGMLEGGHAMDEDYGPSFGRTLSMGTTGDVANTHLAVTPEGARLQQGGAAGGGAAGGGAHAGHAAGGATAGTAAPDVGQATDHSRHGQTPAQTPAQQGQQGGQIPRDPASPGPRGQSPTAPRRMGMIPGYPQDMAMEMDEIVAKPETHGLRPTWTIGMMGMMTMVRVLTPERFEEIQRLKQNWTPPAARVAAQKRGWDAIRGTAIGSSHRQGGHEGHENHK